MKCWNSAFNAPCLRVIIVAVQVGAVENKICVSSKHSGGAQEKGKTGWNLVNHPPKLLGKTSLVGLLQITLIS